MTQRRWLRYVANLLLFTLAALALASLSGLVYSGWRVAQHYTHPRRVARAPGDTPARYGVDYQDVTLETEDGLQLAAWYTPPQNRALILAAHGYPGARIAEIHAMFAGHGYGVLSWDARALGESGGEVSSLGYHEVLDFQAALAYALEQPGVQHVGAFGLSMGAATAIRAAARYPQIEAVVADSAFSSLDETFEQVIPYPLLRPLVRFFAERDSGASIREISPLAEIGRLSPRPVFLLQGADDTTIPSASAERLYAAAGEPRQLWVEPGVGHAMLFWSLRAQYERRVVGFFDDALLSVQDQP